MTEKILVLDDEEKFRAMIAQKLARRGYNVLEAGSLSEALPILRETMLNIVLLDYKLPDGEGLTLLSQIKDFQPDVQVIMLTGQGTMEIAVEAMKRGAYDFLTKPCSFSELEVTLQKAIEKQKLIMENTGLRQAVARQTHGFEIVAESPEMKSILEMTHKVAQTDAPVLILGESGVGKDVIARAIHLWSPRSDAPYIPVNAGAIPEALLESELFGHDKGSFTGASTKKIGLVEMAHNGTLFLDEIGDMPMSLQVKLLRFLETGEFRRIGDTKMRRVSVRIITATNKHLESEIHLGSFRNDLYYRINSLTLEIPSLRDRKKDILPLAEFFLRKEASQDSSLKYEFSNASKECLLNYSFPGNVRELAHLVKRGLLLATDGLIKPNDIWPSRRESTDLPNRLSLAGEAQSVETTAKAFLTSIADEDYPTLNEMERILILSAVEKAKGNRSLTANLLGISQRNLYRKLAEYSKNR